MPQRGVVREGPFGRVAGEAERALVGDPGLAGATEIAQRLRAGGVEQVVARQRAGQGIELGQCHGRAGDLAQRDRPVQADHWGGQQGVQRVIEQQDRGQSVASQVSASAWQATIAACSW